MSSIGVFDVATSGEDEQRMQKQSMHDRIAAAVYDVRAKHGEWLFGARDLDGFNDRAKLAFTSICQTIEPHLHARTGVHRKVMKALEHEWRERQACYPGCHEDEAHAKKFHSDEGSDDEKEASRRQAGPPVHQDPDRAHRVLDQTHQKVDERAQKHHDTLDHAHELVDQRGGGGYAVPDSPDHSRHQLPDWDQQGMGAEEWNDAGRPGWETNNPSYGDPINDLLQTPLGQNFQEQGPSFGRPVQPEVDPNHFANYRAIAAMVKGAEFDEGHDHPELDTHQTFEDHQGDTLEPKGDFDAYKDSVDQGAESKVDHDFTPPDPRSPSPYSVERHDEDGSHNFVPTVTGARACPEYQRIARMISADISAPPGAPGMGGSGAPQGATAPNGAAQAPSTAPVDASTTTAPAGGAGTAPVDPSMGMGAGAPVVASKPRKWALRQIQEVGTKEARLRLLAVARSHGMVDDKAAARIHALLSRKVADSNYLQKADEALTKVLNEKAEEFQNTIAPLQQALITIQQAEQLANPLNVSPPAGTVNVLPGQQQQGAPAPGGQPGMPGSLPPDGGGLGADPAAAGLAGQPPAQQLAAGRKRGGRGKARGGASPRKQGDAVGDFGKWLTKAPGLPNGSPAEVDQFVEQTHRGPRSDNKLHQQYGGGTAPHPPTPAVPKPPKVPKAPVMAALIAEPHNVWSKSPSTVHAEFANRMGSGTRPDDVFRQLVAEIAEHHATGAITNRDAHRAANEAFGRLVMSRKKLAAGEVQEANGKTKAVAPATEQVTRSGDEWLTFDDKGRQKGARRKRAWSGWGPPARHHRVAGWDWDDYQNGYLSDRGRRFECSCGEPVEVPSYHNCKCGKIWNALVIGTGGDRHQASADTFIVREIPRRDGVVVARKRSNRPDVASDKILNQSLHKSVPPPRPQRGPVDPATDDALRRAAEGYEEPNYSDLQGLRRRGTDHFHDGEGRYTGPMRMKAPADPFEGSDNCPECGNHFAQGHDAECGRISKWGKSPRGDLQSVPQKKHDSYSEELDESASGEFPTKHVPKVDTRSKGVQDGHSSKDWYKRDHGSQQFRS